MGMLLVAWQTMGLPWWWMLVAALLYLHVLVLGAVFIRWNFYLVSHHHAARDSRRIALSFDDGPAEETAAILDVLREQGVPAAFFTIGKRAAAQPALVKRWHEEGHLIGNHSYEHGFNFDWKSASAMLEEMEQTNRTVEQITGCRPLLFRPPYGVTNPNVAKALRRSGMRSVGWSVRSFDTTAKDPQALLQRILDRLQGGDVILLHDSMRLTREILTELILQARQKGFTFVRVDQLLVLDAYA